MPTQSRQASITAEADGNIITNQHTGTTRHPTLNTTITTTTSQRDSNQGTYHYFILPPNVTPILFFLSICRNSLFHCDNIR
jgi:hypothetical protein